MTEIESRSSGVAVLAATLAVVAGVLAIWLPPMIAGTDTPTHVAFAMLLANAPSAGGLIETSFAPTSQLFVWLAVPFVGWGPAVASKAAISLTLAVNLAGAGALARALGGRAAPAIAVAVASFFGFSFAMGFFNFTLAAGLGMALLAASVRAAQVPTVGRGLTLAALGGLTVCAHVIVYGMFVVQAVVLALFFVKREHIARAAAVVAIALLPSALASLWLVAGVSGALADAGTAEGLGVQRLAFDVQLKNLWYTSFGGLSPLGWLTASASLAMAIVGAGRRGRAALAFAIALWLVVYAAVPFHVGGWAVAQPRALLPLVAMVIGYAGGAHAPRGAAIGALAICVFQLVTSWPTLRDEGRETADAVAALGTEPPGLAMIVRMGSGGADERPYVLPLHHVAQYAIGRGGVDPDWIGMNPFIHNVRAAAEQLPDRVPPFIYLGRDCALNPACDRFAETVADRAFIVAAPFETVLVSGASEAELGFFDARGFQRLAPARFAPPTARRLDLSVDIDPTLANTALVARLVFDRTIGPYAGVSIPAGPARTVSSIPLGPIPEGTVILELIGASGALISRTPIEVGDGAPEVLPLSIRAQSP